MKTIVILLVIVFSCLQVQAQIGPSPTNYLVVINGKQYQFPLNTWKVGETYSLGQVVIRNGTVYQSIVNDNVAFDPASSPADWSNTVTGSSFQSLTTTGSSGAATLLDGVLNIPQYTGGGLPSGTRGYPLINNAGSIGYGTSQVFVDASQFSGAVAEKINACVTAAISIAGTCDARALGEKNASGQGIATAVTTDVQITVGDSSADPVTLLLPANFYWTGGMSDGTSCTLAQYPNTAIIGQGTPNSNGSGVFGAANTSNLGYVYCTKPISGSNAQNYYYDFGFAIFNYSNSSQFKGHATANNVGAYISGSYDEGTWDHMLFFDGMDTYATEVTGVCCSVKFTSDQFSANYLGIPLYIYGNSSTSGSVVAVSFTDDSIVHNLAGSPVVQITDAGNHSTSVNFTNIYSEVHNDSGGLIQINGAYEVSMTNWTLKAENSVGSGPLVATTNAYNTALTITNMLAGEASGNFSYPVTGVSNGYLGTTTLAATLNSGTALLSYYSTNSAQTFNATSQTQVVPLPAIPSGTDDHVALQTCLTAAITYPYPECYIPEGAWKTSVGLTCSSANSCEISGPGSDLVSITATSTGYNTLTVGNGAGNQAAPTGYVNGITLIGPGASNAGYSALQLNGMNQFRVDDVRTESDDIGVDLINNDYGTQFENLRSCFFSCNVAVNLRTGAQSGSDITFINPWVAGTIAGFSMSGNGGGYHIFGGQVGGGLTSGSGVDTSAAVIMGKDYLTSALGETTADFHGTSFEDTDNAWVVRAFNQVHLTTTGIYVNPTQSAYPAIGFYKNSDAENSIVQIDGTTVSGYWGPTLVSIAGGYGNDAFLEQGTYPGADAPVINGVSTFLTSMAQQSNIYLANVNSSTGMYSPNFTASSEFVAALGASYGTTHGSNGTAGVVTLSGGTVTVSTTSIDTLATAGGAGSVVQLTLESCSNCGSLSLGTVTSGTSFVINSTNVLDASTVYWEIKKLN